MEKTTSTILRVKRRLEDNPQEALLIHCKRAKKSENPESSVFLFTGTVSEESTQSQLLNVLSRQENQCLHTKKIDELLEKVRAQRKATSCESRYKIVNCNRKLSDAELSDYNVVDLECKSNTQGLEEKYAYDLYYPQKKDFDISMLDDIVRINNIEQELVFGSYRENNEDASSENEDSDDSNEENNWRNDYPEEEEDNESIGDEDIRRAVENCDIGNDLSSDDDVNLYDDGPDKNLTIDPDDVTHYGLAYAKYKARILKERNVSNSKGDEFLNTIDDRTPSSDDEGFYYGQHENTEHFRSQYRSEDSDDLSS